MSPLTRRAFLKSTAVTALLASTARAADAAPVPILDTHTHFYDPTRPEGVPWPSKDDKVLYRPVLPEHFVALTKPLGVVGTVVVEASHRLEDNQWILDLAEKNPALVGLVGHLKPGAGDFSANLDRFRKHARFVGLRIGHHELKANLDDKAYLANLDRLGDKLVLDINGGPEMLADVARLAKKLPDLKIVVNHLANVPIDGRTPPEAWRKGMSAAANHPHVACKLSAYVEGAARNGKKASADPAYYKPVFDVAWDTFGEDRLLWGSNWPVSERAADYQTLLTIARSDVAARKGNPALVFAGNARRIYGISEP